MMSTTLRIVCAVLSAVMMLTVSACSRDQWQIPTPIPKDSRITLTDNSVSMGKSDKVVDVWFTPSCPECSNIFAGKTVQLTEAISRGGVQIKLHPVSRDHEQDIATRALFCVGTYDTVDTVFRTMDMMHALDIKDIDSGTMSKKLSAITVSANATACLNSPSSMTVLFDEWNRENAAKADSMGLYGSMMVATREGKEEDTSDPNWVNAFLR